LRIKAKSNLGKIYTNIIYKMERGLMMLLHSVIIGLILYLIMLFGLKQPPAVAENRSLLAAALILIYMLLFGHGLPKMPMNI